MEKPPPSECVAEADTSADRFLAAAARRQEILDTMAATQHAKAALYQTRLDLLAVGDHRGDVFQTARRMKEATEREKKEWMKLKGSRLRKLFGGAAYAAELKREEDDYYEAYEWQLRAEAAARERSGQIVALSKKKDALLKQVEEHREAQVQLMDLYEELFDGPTPNYPEEDELESELNALQEAFDSIQGKITHTYNVCEVLGRARSAVQGALEAAQNSYDTTLSSLGSMTLNLVGDMVQPEHGGDAATTTRRTRLAATGGTLEQLRQCLARADQSLAAAQRLDPDVLADARLLPQVDPEGRARHTGRVDRLLNAPLTDIFFYQEIADAGEALATAARVALCELRARLLDDATCPPPRYTGEVAAESKASKAEAAEEKAEEKAEDEEKKEKEEKEDEVRAPAEKTEETSKT
ncbi:hypothetical protein IF1G_10899 [Cordyceps javanica]|uniref:Uncharacterized protein n=1 Tax=Cordyceps javanica TaxID=43265 RepID=A0A545ULT8_9HYPO|nr:hypothetical protein IF1G_10899 [Cordyceps javanica]